MIDPSARIHPSADLEDDVSVGPGRRVWHRAQVRTGAPIGADCVIGRDAFIDEGVVLGDRVKVQNGALVYHGVTVGDGVFIGPGAILTNDRNPRAVTATGDLARARGLDGHPDPPRRWRLDRRRRGRRRRRATSARTRWSAPARSSRTTVAGYALVVGNPARRIGWVCACGERALDASGARRRPTLDRCPSSSARCDRRYAYVPDAETLEERSGPVVSQGAPA